VEENQGAFRYYLLISDFLSLLTLPLLMQDPSTSNYPVDSGAAIDEEELLESLRAPLRSFVMCMLPHQVAGEEVVQETLLYLWEHRSTWEEATNMNAWAFRIARFKAMAWRRDQSRDRLVFFADDTVMDLAGEAEHIAEESVQRLDALGSCLNAMSSENFALIEHIYLERRTLADVARESGDNPKRLYKKMTALRNALKRCVESKLKLP
jgi:RNA polymerase sigma-70 factor (ECF subfamily)